MPEQAKLNLYSKYKYIWEQLDNTMDSLFSYIQHYPVIEMDGYGNITVCNTQEKNIPAFCCHLDTVHKNEPELELVHDILLISTNDEGVGGDDKCGIVACLELLQSVPCKCIFFRDEERGCQGSHDFDTESLKDNLFCIEIDRRGARDLIFDGSNGEMCGKEFQDRVKKFFPHCSPTKGGLTDVCVLGNAGINMMNLSAGYYKPHTAKEYVVLPELQTNINCLRLLAMDIMKNPLKNKNYERRTTYYATWGDTQKNFWSKKQDDMFDKDAGEDDYNACQYGTGVTRSGADVAEKSSAQTHVDSLEKLYKKYGGEK